MSNLLDRITITEPCSESWDEMIGNGEVRFCSHCAKHVHDLSSMTRPRAEELIRSSNGRLCARYGKRQLTIIQAPPPLTRITRRATIAAGVLAGALACSYPAVAQGRSSDVMATPEVSSRAGSTKRVIAVDTFSVNGVVLDPNGAAIPGASVILRNTTSKSERTTKTDSEGRYEFRSVAAGDYELEISGIAGFTKQLVQGLRLTENANMTQTLVPEPVTEHMLGVVGIVEGPLITTSETETSRAEIQPRPLEPVTAVPRPNPKKKKNKLPK